MTNILQHAAQEASPPEAANLIPQYAADIKVVQHGLTTPEWEMYLFLWALGRKHITKSGSRLVKIGTAAIRALRGWSKSKILRLVNILIDKGVLRIALREQPWTSEARTLEIFSFIQIKAIWRDRGWVKYVCHQGKQFADAMGNLYELARTKLPELVRRVQEARKAIQNAAVALVKPADLPALENAKATQTFATQASAAEIAEKKERLRYLKELYDGIPPGMQQNFASETMAEIIQLLPYGAM